MYTILVSDNNELITTSKQRIMQRSKLVDTLHFLVNPIYNGLNMADFTAMLEYTSPETGTYSTETLILSDALFKDRLEYKLPIDTDITKEAGEVHIKLSFASVEMSGDGEVAQYIRKAGPGSITVIPYDAWSDAIPDESLSAIDQRLLKAEMLIQAANDFNAYLDETKADNIVIDKESNTVQLTSNGNPIGDAIGWTSNGDIVTDVEIDEHGHLVVTLSDGRVIDAGYVGSGAKGTTFIPHISDDYILSWTNDGGLDNPDPVDLNFKDNWSEVGDENETAYVWNQL